LMTRYAEERRPEMAAALARHLQWIAKHPECVRSPLANASTHLSQQCQRMAVPDTPLHHWLREHLLRSRRFFHKL
ncbi:MAG: hypothetical protein LC647_02485, partial [Beggiatoa sp.]|nr:hypothetical protein [Beggiatoa sp.]